MGSFFSLFYLAFFFFEWLDQKLKYIGFSSKRFPVRWFNHQHLYMGHLLFSFSLCDSSISFFFVFLFPTRRDIEGADLDSLTDFQSYEQLLILISAMKSCQFFSTMKNHGKKQATIGLFVLIDFEAPDLSWCIEAAVHLSV